MHWRLSILLLVLPIACGTSSDTVHAPYPLVQRAVPSSPAFVFLSDTQSPLWFETLRLPDDDNETATRKILNAITADSSCVAVFHLGDLTALGSFDSYWKDFDEETEALREAGIPLYPVFGNHEYMPFARGGKEHMIRRFPFMERSWYEQRVGRVVVLLLNSNFSSLSERERQDQGAWYTRTLRELDADSTVSVILVGCHHPAYTNSTIVNPSEEVQRIFVPPFMQSRKAKLFLSGHAHAYERFHINGKDFVVIGGAGGLLHPLLQGKELRWPDRYSYPGERRFFHYVRCTFGGAGLEIRVMRLLPDKTRFEAADSLNIPFSS
jgi:predicted phosphodiesterase